ASILYASPQFSMCPPTMRSPIFSLSSRGAAEGSAFSSRRDHARPPSHVCHPSRLRFGGAGDLLFLIVCHHEAQPRDLLLLATGNCLLATTSSARCHAYVARRFCARRVARAAQC